ncbi:MAG TPA: putative Fe-S cluster assembly protein SufT [Gammaproteobacteria bacterium]|nr:putative Fe-S cluster assembly protein SufT [Gammaproteobacteria bacterium]
MEQRERVILTRDCKAIFVPLGLRVNARKGKEVEILQELGGAFTVLLDGQMARIDAADADVLGREREPLPVELYEGKLTREKIEEFCWEHMRTVYDPEIPVNVVDLGLIYEFTLSGANDKYRADVKMTLTAPGCGMGDVLVEDVKYKLEVIPGIVAATVELVLDPPWGMEMMSEAARLQTGMM